MIRFFVALLFLPISLLVFSQDKIAQNSTDWRGLIQLARTAYNQKDYSRAMLFYETALPVIPKDIDIAEEIAQTQYRLKQFDAAASSYEKRTGGNQIQKARAKHNLGNIAMQKKDYDGAIKQYKAALRENPLNEKTRYNLSQAMRKKQEEQKKNPPPKDNKDPKDNDKKDDKEKEKKKDQNDSKNQDNPSALSDNSVERELDKLMRKEAQTKRKVASSKEGNAGKKSTKEW